MKTLKLLWNVILDGIALIGWFLVTVYDTLVTPKNNDHEDHY